MLAKLIGDRFLKHLMASERGRAFMLSFMKDAEEGDEQEVFNTLLVRVDDEKLHGLVQRHKSDEERHAGLLGGCLAREGKVAQPMPAHLRYVQRIDALLGDGGTLAERFVGGTAGVMEAYVMLLVVEERAVKEWPAIVAALRSAGETETADVVASIIEDEKRHVKYATAIARRYAPDDATLARLYAQYRAAEEEAFAAHTVVFSREVMERELLDVGGLERGLWRMAAGLSPFRAGGIAISTAQ